MTLARLEVQVLLTRQQVQHIIVADEIPRVPPARQPQQRPLVTDAARMIREMTDRDALAEIRQLRYVLPDVVVDRELAVCGEQQDRRGRELLRDGCDVKHAGWRQFDVVIEIRHPVRVAVDDAGALIETDGTARRAGLAELSKDLVDPGPDRAIVRAIRHLPANTHKSEQDDHSACESASKNHRAVIFDRRCPVVDCHFRCP